MNYEALDTKHRQHVHAGKCHGRLAAPKYERMEYLTGSGNYCDGCYNDWPCDTRTALDAARADTGDLARGIVPLVLDETWVDPRNRLREAGGEHPIDPWTLARVRNTLDAVLARMPAAPKHTDDAIAYRDGWLDAIRAIRTEMEVSARAALTTQHTEEARGAHAESCGCYCHQPAQHTEEEDKP